MKSYLDKAEELLDRSERTESDTVLGPLFAAQAQAAALIEIAYSLDTLCGILIDAFRLNAPEPDNAGVCWCDDVTSTPGPNHSTHCPLYEIGSMPG